MKKAFALLLALALIGGAVFAQEASVSGSAVLSWGIDLDTNATGFRNEGSFTVTLPLIDESTPSVGGDGDVYGYIEIEDLEWEITEDDGTGVLGSSLAGSLSAKLVFKPFEVAVYSAPSIAINMMAAIDSGDAEYGGVGDFGTTVTYMADPLEVGVTVMSADDWEGNADNDYAIGATFSFVAVPDLLDINAAVAYDLADTTSTFYAGVEAPIAVADIMSGLEVTPAADFIIGDPLQFDLGAVLALYVAEANEDDDQSGLSFTGYYSNIDENAEISLAFDEYLLDGLADNVEFGFALKSIDFLDAVEFPWEVETYAGYKFVIDDMNDLYGRVDFDIDSADNKNLTLLVEFTNISVANTTLTLTYTSGNLVADPAVLGTFVAAATIEL